MFDLRGNPGGLLAQGAAVADLFLNRGQLIVSLHGRSPEPRRDFVDQAGHRKWGDLSRRCGAREPRHGERGGNSWRARSRTTIAQS